MHSQSEGGDYQMKLSQGEKIILTMLSEIYQKLGIQGEIDPNIVKTSIFSGHTWVLEHKYPVFIEAIEPSDSDINETCEILDMWQRLEASYDSLDEAGKREVEKNAKIYGKDPRFIGFDGNSDPHFGIAHHLIEDLDLFKRFKSQGLNAQATVLDGYRRMLVEFRKMQSSASGRNLDASEICRMLNALVHPESR
jgi:uncharacterized protein